MEDHDGSALDETRREFLKTAGAGVLATVLGGHLPGNPARARRRRGPGTAQGRGWAYNILFILTDQESTSVPESSRRTTVSRPRAVGQNGVVFENTASTPACAPRRAPSSTPAATSSRRGCSTT